jgi:hypothetical protein
MSHAGIVIKALPRTGLLFYLLAIDHWSVKMERLCKDEGAVATCYSPERHVSQKGDQDFNQDSHPTRPRESEPS